MDTILSSDVRKAKIEALTRESTPEGTQKLYYKGQSRQFPVYRIDLDWLIYNRHNGRIEAEMITWEQEHYAAPDVYNSELHQLIGDLLWESNVGRNKNTLKNLELYTQQRPGIISLDGVVIDGNRRSMLLRKLEGKGKPKQYFDALILPDAYEDNEKEIVRLETQYQIGEDAKVDYGPIQKYLHARRLKHDLGFEESDIDKLMGKSGGYAKKLLEIMELMDEYLIHIGCPKLYTMLKDDGGTKEGMFVDIHRDLKRLAGGNAKVPWDFDPELDLLQLKLIHFDHARFGSFADGSKVYREISSQSKGKNFFATEEIWKKFSASHSEKVDPITAEMGSLNSFIEEHNDDLSKVEAAKHRDQVWISKVSDSMKETFGRASYELGLAKELLAPSEYLQRAKDSLEKLDLDSSALFSDARNLDLATTINQISYEIKKRFKNANTHF